MSCSNISDNSSIFCGSKSNDSVPRNISSTTEISADDYKPGNVGRIIVVIIYGLIFIVGLIGNSLVLIVVATNKKMRDPTNLLIFNLAAADLLFIIFCVPFAGFLRIINIWPFGWFCCKLFSYIIYVNSYESAATLILMSGIRFLAIVFPLKSNPFRTQRNTLKAIGISWIVVLVINVPFFIFSDVQRFSYNNEEQEFCLLLDEYLPRFETDLIICLTSYALPLLLITIFYIAILCRLRKRGPNSSASEEVQQKRNRNISRMIIAVICGFAFCLFLQSTIFIIQVVIKTPISLDIVANVLWFSNSCLNPILYAFLSENFRKEFKKLIQCKIRCVLLEHRSSSQEIRGPQIFNGDQIGK